MTLSRAQLRADQEEFGYAIRMGKATKLEKSLWDSLSLYAAELERVWGLLETLTEDLAPEFDDSRLKYIVVQMTREVLEEARVYLAQIEEGEK